MSEIILLGFGNVGKHLFTALDNAPDISISQIYNRSTNTLSDVPENIPATSNISEIKDADVYIIAIPDDAIASFSKSLALRNKLVVHTSGGMAMEILSDANRKGVFYPLQTFSKNKKLDFQKIPICIEAESAADLKTLKKIGAALSDKVFEINSEERAKLHLAAVFVNNFVNYLYSIGQDILESENLSFDLLKPLILETARKTETLSPREAQTGPAIRKDKKTIQKHLHLLAESPYRELYIHLTEVIQEKYKN